MPKPFGKSDTQRRNGNRNFGVVLGPAASDHNVLRRHESGGIFRQSRQGGVKPDTISGLPMTPLDEQLQSGRQNPHKPSTYGKASVRRSDLAPVVRYVSLVKPDTFSPLPERMGRIKPVDTPGGYPSSTHNDPFNSPNGRFSAAQHNNSYNRRRPGF